MCIPCFDVWPKIPPFFEVPPHRRKNTRGDRKSEKLKTKGRVYHRGSLDTTPPVAVHRASKQHQLLLQFITRGPHKRSAKVRDRTAHGEKH